MPEENAATLTERLSEWASTTKPADLPDRVMALTKSQVISQLAAIRAGSAHPLGLKLTRAFGPPWQTDPARSAAVLASLGSWLHLDDTAYAGHLSISTVAVPVAYAHALGLAGSELLTAVVTATECAARVTAAATLGPFRGQSAAHSQLAGAVAGRLRCAGAPATVWVNAFGLAFGAPPWSLMRAFLGSDAKVVSAIAPVRAALDACDAAEAGLAGAPDIMEHPDGFLARFATVPLGENLVDELGTRWHTDTLSFKAQPGGPGVDAAVDCALALHGDLGPLEVADVAEVVVTSSLYTLAADHRVQAYLDGPRSPVSALGMSTGYLVATALLTGAVTAADLASPHVDDPRRWELAAKVRLAHDDGMTRDLMHSVAPVGEALRQAGDRAGAWLGETGGQWLVDLVGDPGPPSTTYEHASKVTPARVEVRLSDGRVVRRELAIPVGAAGSPQRARHGEFVREKFLTAGGPVAAADALAELELLTPDELRDTLELALS
ncbi:MmgE/PrpD family protein [Actinophytocola sp.]|uniref:MmgE/PrpD family protein n=1 Tax=Actinophytocola sp. TaxID=1872138 RepID=UPI002ECFD9C2